MEDHPFSALGTNPSENSDLVLRSEELTCESSIPDHQMGVQPPISEHDLTLKDRFSSILDNLILQKTHELSQLNSVKSQYSPILENTHLTNIRSNSFTQPFFAGDGDKESGSLLLSTLQSNDNPSVISSNLSDLFRYSSISGDFSSVSSISLDNAPLSNPQLNWKGRSLQVSHDKILLTGGSHYNTQTLIINTLTREVQVLPPLQEGRELHAMAWIDHKPAVLGGLSSHNWPLGSVEVFAKGCWEKAKPMNSKRYGLSACTVKDSVWVFGGAESRGTGIANIEYYGKGTWHTTLTKIPQSMVGIGVVGLGEKVLLFGGLGNDGNNTNKVLVFNTETYELRECKSLESPCSFSQNLWKVHNNCIEGCSFRGNKIIYYLE